MRDLSIDLSGLLPHQRKLVKSKSRKSALICGRGAGKSYVCAALVLLYLLMGKNVLVGGSTHDTIHETLYDEIKKLAQEWGIFDLITWRESPMMMEMGNARCWFGFFQAVDSIRGYSRVNLIILDEAFLAPVNILSIWGPCMRNADGRTRIVAATTPRQGSMWNVLFSDPKCDWEIIRASSMDNTHIDKDELDLILSEIKTDAMYKQEILGEIETDLGASAIINLKDFVPEPAYTNDERVIAGFDAGEGVERDASAFFKRKGNTVLEMWKMNGINHEEAVKRIRDSNKRLKIDQLNMDAAFSDYEYNILKYEISCEQVNFARSPSEQNKDKYANVRAEMYFNFADALKHGACIEGFELTPELKRQLCAIAWHRNNQGRLLLTKKEELREALKMSTDIADAGALTYLDLYTGDEPEMKSNVQDRRKLRRYASFMGG